MVYFAEIDITGNNKSPFGEIITCQTTQLAHLHFAYTLNSESMIYGTSGGSISTSDGLLNVSVGVAGAGAWSWFKSKRSGAYEPGIGIECRFSMLYGPTAPTQTGAKQLCGIGEMNSSGGVVDGFFLGFDYTAAGNTSSFLIQRVNNSVITTTLAANFTHDKLDGTGPTGINIASSVDKLNAFKISFAWLGSANILYYIYDPNIANWSLFHEIRFGNTSNNTSCRNPTLRFCSRAIGRTDGTTNNYYLKHASVSILQLGKEWLTTGLLFSRSNSKTSITTENNILTLRNDNDVFGSVGNNRSVVKIKQISFSCDGTKNTIFRGYINASVSGTPSYTKIAEFNSVCSYDTAGTTISFANRNIVSYSLGKVNNDTVDVDNLYIILYPGDTFTMSASSTANSDVFVSIVFAEDNA